MDSEESLANIETAELEAQVPEETPQKLASIPGSVANVIMCDTYPLLAVATDTGFVNVYELKSEEFLCNYSYSYSATSIIWPDAKLDGIGASLIVGFDDGTLHWLNLVKNEIKHIKKAKFQKEGIEEQIQEGESEVLEDVNASQSQNEEYVNIQKSENEVLENLSHNQTQSEQHINVPKDENEQDNGKKDEIQDNDEKQDKDEQDDKKDEKQDNDKEEKQDKDEQDVKKDEKQDIDKKDEKQDNDKKDEKQQNNEQDNDKKGEKQDNKVQAQGLIAVVQQEEHERENSDPEEINLEPDQDDIQPGNDIIEEVEVDEVYNLNLRSFTKPHVGAAYCLSMNRNSSILVSQLGDKISDINLEETSEIGKEVLENLKYKEKKEKREAREQELGISRHITPPKILCFLPSTVPGRIWLSLGKNDTGYLFEFEFVNRFQNQPIDFIPLRALEVETSEMVPILSMNFSSCGNFLLMGPEDRTLHICHLKEPFDPSSGHNFRKIEADESGLDIVDCVYISPDGSLLTKGGQDKKQIEFKLNMAGFKDLIDYRVIPAFINESSDKFPPCTSSFTEVLSLEEALQLELSKKYNESKKQIMQRLEKLKSKYMSFKEEYDAYMEECRVSLKKIENIPEHLKLNIELVSNCPTAVKFFREKIKVLQKDLDKKFERDLVTVSLTKQNFKSRIKCEKFSVENDGEKLDSYRECNWPPYLTLSHEKPLQVYGVKVEKKENPQDDLERKSEKKRKNKTIDELKRKLSSVTKNIIDYSESGAASDIVLKYNKRKQELAGRLRERIATEEALESIVLNEEAYKNTEKEIDDHLYRFKDDGNYDYSYPSLKSTFSKKHERTSLFLSTVCLFFICYPF
ncbi:uncharacterized protein TNCV_2587841 [Trichonephila clavipes]|nr:uncharacterized protein TNCV_2587841 [Trichonephila clavipes]